MLTKKRGIQEVDNTKNTEEETSFPIELAEIHKMKSVIKDITSVASSYNFAYPSHDLNSLSHVMVGMYLTMTWGSRTRSHKMRWRTLNTTDEEVYQRVSASVRI